MKNSEIAKIFYHLALFEEMKDEFFKARAYDKAARMIEGHDREIEDVYRGGGLEALQEIESIGKAISEKIEEILKTGRLRLYEEHKKEFPIDLDGLTSLEGIGPKTIKALYQKLNVKTIEDLEKIIAEGKLKKLPGFGEKKERQIRKSIEFFKQGRGRFLLGEMLLGLRNIESRLKRHPAAQDAMLCGSARRMKETIGDADFLVVSDAPDKVMDFFVTLPEVVHVYSKGTTKSNVRLSSGIDADLRIVGKESFGAAMQYFTGNKDHNVVLRSMAIMKGWKLNEYGIYEGERQIAGKSEEEIYRVLGLDYIPPEMRENNGEIDLASSKKLPKLIEYGSLKGDLQVQTNYTDGLNSIEEMADAAKKIGLEYIAITDHTKSLGVAGGLDEERIADQGKHIDAINKNLEGFRILKGAEVNILKDGTLDIADTTLKELDVVGASVHSAFDLPKEEQTRRVLKAVENPNVDILFHPTGRLINKRAPYEIDIEKIIEKCSDVGTILEINAYPDRLDLKDDYIRKAVQIGAKLCINSDAHSTSHFQYLEYGIGQARRGWVSAEDMVNTFAVNSFLASLKH
ncbi:MAG: DNA polymerase/3'-5' exonuclease PolX [Thaumarchaeota archaeon]|nr:DNA polymerase/3'-5' exonuclease PolX [Nitrososphaerota archaeon]